MSTYKGFDSIQLRAPQRAKFDLSHEKRLSGRMGRLIPVFVSEAMPNDTFRISTEVMIRLAPMLAPIMHMLTCYVHYFFIPNRLLWKDWEPFITGGRLGTETPPIPPNTIISYLLDQNLDLLDKGSLADYYNIRPIPDTAESTWSGTNPTASLDVMPVAAYYKVWYDYYRDRNYVADNEKLPLASGNTLDVEFWKIRQRAWEHDYFTSALPWTQRGNEVLLPLMGSGSVTYSTVSRVFDAAGNPINTDTVLGTDTAPPDLPPGGHLYVGKTGISSGGTQGRIENIDGVSLDASDVTINEFRQAIRLQEWLERNAVAGSRYNESIYAHFARRTSDGRLQRAEYLGGGKSLFKISEVLTTAYSTDSEDTTVPPANMSGHGLTYGRSNRVKYNCEEHGFVLGVMSIMPTSAYMQGIPRMFLARNTFLDYPWPSFAHLGEQVVADYEIYADVNSVPALADRDTPELFGYQSRYADWKFIHSSTHGDFRESLDFWHLTRKFNLTPTLGDTFIQFEDALQDRIFAVQDVDTLWCYIYNRVSVVRSLPYFGTPTL